MINLSPRRSALIRPESLQLTILVL